MQQVRAKKSLGQHFLKDLSVAQRIAETISSTLMPPMAEGEKIRVLEIGPGMGVLTQFLLQNPEIDLTAIELDKESVEYLQNLKSKTQALQIIDPEKIKSDWTKLNLIEGDFLKLELETLYKEGPFCVIGNYPYNISSQIFFKVLEYRERIPLCSGMIQKEVAERIASKPGKKAYGILSVLLQAYYDIEYLFTVDEYVFAPPPKVKSAVIRLRRNNRQHLGCDEQLFKTVVKTAFNQRRKQLKNSLRELAPGLDDKILTMRPEQLSVDEFIDLTRKIEQQCQN